MPRPSGHEAPPTTQSRGLKLHGRAFRRRGAGFTIIEVLVAAGITAFIAGFIAVIVRNVSITWTRASNRLGTDAQARLIMDQLQLDLQGAMYRDDGKWQIDSQGAMYEVAVGNLWLAADVLNGTGTSQLWQVAARNPKPVGGISLDMPATRPELLPAERLRLDRARFGTAGIRLRFFTTSRGTNNASQIETVSAPVAVGYQIIRRFTATNPASQRTAYLLHRSEARPATSGGRIGVLEAGFNITSGNYTTNTTSTNNGSNPRDPRAIQVPGATRILDSVVGDNVIDFGVRCYVRDSAVPGGLRLIFPANASGALSNSANARLLGSLPATTPVTATNYQFLFPDVVDVMVRILTDEGAQLIENIERIQNPALIVPQKYNGNAQLWWWGIVDENSRTYTRRIVLNAKPL